MALLGELGAVGLPPQEEGTAVEGQAALLGAKGAHAKADCLFIAATEGGDELVQVALVLVPAPDAGGQGQLLQLEQVLAGLKKAFPPLRRLSMRQASSRAASVLAMMLSSGFPLEQALEMVPLVLPDAEAAGEIAKIREKMGEGVSFSDALTGSAMFDEIHRQMLRMGIAAGREDQVMSKIAQTYEQQVEEGISGLVSVIEPTMVAALSIVIGAVLLSVMMPMAGISGGSPKPRKVMAAS